MAGGWARIGRAAVVAACGALALSACAYMVGSWADGAAGHPDALIFSHKRHVVGESLDCGDCHSGVASSDGLQGARAMPKESTCLECHEKKGNCKQCHATPDAPQGWVDHRMPGVLFSHKAHMPRVSKDGKAPDACLPCHDRIKDNDKVSDDTRPGMITTCNQCHAKDLAKGDCTRCHIQDSLGRVVSNDIFDHGGDFLRRHGNLARGGEGICMHCHKVDTCSNCHSRTNPALRPVRFGLDRPDQAQHHRGDFAGRHGVEARLDPKACTSCHAVQTCQECHQRMGVGPTGAQANPANPHPKGYLVRGNTPFHGSDAWRDVASCAACHDQGAASGCVACHKVGAAGGNPHPPGWAAGGRDVKSAGCVHCHGP